MQFSQNDSQLSTKSDASPSSEIDSQRLTNSAAPPSSEVPPATIPDSPMDLLLRDMKEDTEYEHPAQPQAVSAKRALPPAQAVEQSPSKVRHADGSGERDGEG